MTRVKICGLMNQRDVNLCVQAGVDMVGFVVDYPASVPWNISKKAAKGFVSRVPPFVSTCVVTGGPPEVVIELIKYVAPDVVQLHYKETLREITEIASDLKEKGIKTIKALRLNQEGKCDFEIADPAEAARELAHTGISAVLVDSYTEVRPGGTGMTVDLGAFRAIQKNSPLPVILAGGLNPENISSILKQVHSYGVDVLTGVEQKPGYKDEEKVRLFTQNVRQVD